jgi:hypothetical protein
MCVLFKDQEIIPARNVMDARAQKGVVKNDEFLVPILQALAHYVLNEMLHDFSLLVVAELSLLPTAV